MRSIVGLIAMAVAAMIPLTALSADDPGIDFFEKKIRPLLVEHCDECHSTNSK
ncbi:MAG: hypothetical protein H7062_21925, partial [Candidatus Saccharimonas sp.]|nr:hypothetical protein [Planctomycetaceae bacterium]